MRRYIILSLIFNILLISKTAYANVNIMTDAHDTNVSEVSGAAESPASYDYGAADRKLDSHSENVESIESEFVLSNGGISDGESIWLIPFEEGSFGKINIETGKKDDLSHLDNYEKLSGLSGYKSGALHDGRNGNRYIYLVPFEVTKPLVRINLETLKMDYPIRNVGYYFGSCQLASDGEVDYLWLFPSKEKPKGAPSKTEIVKLNLTEGKKESTIETKIGNNIYTFSNSLMANEYIWLLPKEERQPLIRIDTKKIGDSLASDGVKKIYSDENFKFSKISTAAFDGSCLWFVCEDVSFMFNDSVLVKCDQEGRFIDKQALSKEQYVESGVDDKYVYFFSGAPGKIPGAVKADKITGEQTILNITLKSGYIPGYVDVSSGERKNITIIPRTSEGKEKPVVKLVDGAKVTVVADMAKKVYRDFGDVASGSRLEAVFGTPEGFTPTDLYWYVSASEENITKLSDDRKDMKEVFEQGYNESTENNRMHHSVKSTDSISLSATKNGYYRFMVEFVNNSENDKKIYAFSEMEINNIFERLPITISRFDIEKDDEKGILERKTYKKDFGAAFSFSGDEFIRTDAPMDIIPAQSIEIDDNLWTLETPNNYTLSIGEIAATEFKATLGFNYRAKKSETFDEGLEVEAASTIGKDDSRVEGREKGESSHSGREHNGVGAILNPENDSNDENSDGFSDDTYSEPIYGFDDEPESTEDYGADITSYDENRLPEEIDDGTNDEGRMALEKETALNADNKLFIEDNAEIGNLGFEIIGSEHDMIFGLPLDGGNANEAAENLVESAEYSVDEGDQADKLQSIYDAF